MKKTELIRLKYGRVVALMCKFNHFYDKYTKFFDLDNITKEDLNAWLIITSEIASIIKKMSNDANEFEMRLTLALRDK